MTPPVVHLDYAGSGPPLNSVVAAVCDHLHLEVLNGGYGAAGLVQERLAKAYEDFAALLGCKTEEVAVMAGGSTAWNALFHAMRFRPGDRILTTTWEYGGAVSAMRQRAALENLTIDVAPSGPGGTVDLARFQEMLHPRTRMVAITWTPTCSGVVEPVEAIGRLVAGRPLFFLIDAAQALGQRPVDVKAIGCHGLIASGRKYLRGPRGTALLYLDHERTDLQPSQIDHWTIHPDLAGHPPARSDARRFEMWERSIALTLGLGEAARHALGQDLDRIRSDSNARARRLRTGLAEYAAVDLLDPVTATAPIVGFRVRAEAAETFASRLRQRGITLTVSHPRSTPLSPYMAPGPALRLSPHAHTTVREVDIFFEILTELLKESNGH